MHILNLFRIQKNLYMKWLTQKYYHTITLQCLYIIYRWFFLSAEGYVDIVNFRDVTTESDLEKKTATFEFEFDPLIRLNPSLGYDGCLTWKPLGEMEQEMTFIITDCINEPEYLGQLESIGSTGTYRLSAPSFYFGKGQLLVNLAMNITCNENPYSCRCSKWQVRGKSTSLEISAKRG